MKRHVGMLVLTAVVAIGMTGCGSATRNVKFNDGYQVAKETKIEVPPAKNATGKTFEELDVEKALTEGIISALGDEGILADNTYTGRRLLLPCRITEYEPGNAFKRWLMPFYGSTVLDVKCEVREIGSDNAVGVAEARRTVDAGGLYTVGAWKQIFNGLSTDIAKEIKTKMPK